MFYQHSLALTGAASPRVHSSAVWTVFLFPLLLVLQTVSAAQWDRARAQEAVRGAGPANLVNEDFSGLDLSGLAFNGANMQAPHLRASI